MKSMLEQINQFKVETGVERFFEKIEIPKGSMELAEWYWSDFVMERRAAEFERRKAFPLSRYSHIGLLCIPESIRTIGDDELSPFVCTDFVMDIREECSRYRRIKIDGIENHSSEFHVEDGVLYSADKSKIVYCFEDKTNFVIPEGVKDIAPFAFCGQRRLKSVELPSTLQKIGVGSFLDCRMLKKIIIPGGVTEIPARAFDNCIRLKQVFFAEGVLSLGVGAFCHCEALRSIYLPDSIREIHSFHCCYSLKEVVIPKGVREVDGFNYCRGLRKVKLHSGVRRIFSNAFEWCNKLKDINLPEGLQTIGYRAFRYNTKLKTLEFPSSLQKIEEEAFWGCKSLVSLVFNSNVNIESGAFHETALQLEWNIDKTIRKPDSMRINPYNIFSDNRTNYYKGIGAPQW